MHIYNKFFNSISENESLYEIIKCIVTSVSLNDESNLNFNILNNNECIKYSNDVISATENYSEKQTKVKDAIKNDGTYMYGFEIGTDISLIKKNIINDLYNIYLFLCKYKSICR